MLYKFKSKAAGDVIMLGPDGDRLLALLGRAPAPKGIIEVAHLPQALALLRAVVQAAPAASPDAPDPAAPEPEVGLQRRLWPVLELLQRAQAAGEPVVWGV